MTDASARIERDLDQLLRIPSITGDEQEIQDLLAGLLEDAGARVERFDVPLASLSSDREFPGTEVDRDTLPIVIGRVGREEAGPTLMLQGHVDVVPPGDPATWTTPPFEPAVRDGRMYGRGACDMKAGVLANLEVVRRLADQELSGELIILFVPSEEDGGSGAYAAIRHGVVADACVITEPTGLDIVVAHAGAITFTLDVPGKAAHASVRREGVSALDNLTYVLDALKDDEARRNGSEGHPLMQALGLPYATIVGQVEGGEWASTVMDRVIAHGRYGVRLGQDCDGAAADLRLAVEAAAAEHDFLSDHPPRVEVWGGRFDSSSIPIDHPLPRSLQESSRQVGVGSPSLIGAPYGADMRLHIHQGNTPTVMYGPGQAAQAHSADEFVPLVDIDRCATVLTEWASTGLG